MVAKLEREDDVNMELRAAREASGKTQSQVAKEIGVNTVSYQRYESENRVPNAVIAILIARALGSTVEKLFGAATPDNTKEPRTEGKRTNSEEAQHQKGRKIPN